MWSWSRHRRAEALPPRILAAAILAAILTNAAPAAATSLPPAPVSSTTHDTYVWVGGLTLGLAAGVTILDAAALRSDRPHRPGLATVSALVGGTAVVAAGMFAMSDSYERPVPGGLVYANIVTGTLAVILGVAIKHQEASGMSLGPSEPSPALAVVAARTPTGSPAMALSVRW